MFHEQLAQICSNVFKYAQIRSIDTPCQAKWTLDGEVDVVLAGAPNVTGVVTCSDWMDTDTFTTIGGPQATCQIVNADTLRIEASTDASIQTADLLRVKNVKNSDNEVSFSECSLAQPDRPGVLIADFSISDKVQTVR